jgi:acetyltransferase-like isoleucine patch superfamily enzyme
MQNSFRTREEIGLIGLKAVGENVFISRFANFYDSGNIEIGHDVRIDDYCILSGHIKIGSYIHISAHTALYGRFGIEMEDYTGLSPRCTVFSASDDFSGRHLIGPMVNPAFHYLTTGKVLMKKFSQLGANCVVLPGVTINEGAVALAISLVLNDLEAWKIYKGIPAVYYKERSQRMLDFLK